MNSLAHSSQLEYLWWTKLFTFRMRSTHHELLARNSIQARPKSYGLSPSSPNTTKHVYTSHNLGNIKQNSSNSTHKHGFSTFSPKPRVFAQVSPSASLKLTHLAWASVKQWLHHIISLRRALLAWERLRSLNHQAPRLDEDSPKKTQLVSSRPRLGEPPSPERENMSLNTKRVAWARRSTQNQERVSATLA